MATDHRISLGRDYNFFKKKTISSATFGSPVDGYYPDVLITFPVQSFALYNEGTGIIEYSFNGFTVHGELNPATVGALLFDHRTCNKIWFRLKSGSSSVVRVDAWAKE